MDVRHHPLLHSWREFITEIGIIVIGVLIALAGEQCVQAFHGMYQTRATETALHAEIQESANAAAERRSVDSCLREQLAELRDAVVSNTPLRSHDAGDRRRIIRDFYQAPWRPWTQGR